MLGKDAIVDQIVIVVDLKGAKLKDLSNKQLKVIFQTLLIEFKQFFPEMVHAIYVLNAPMFFNGLYETDVLPHLAEKTIAKVRITGENSHPELLESFDMDKLPKLYGGEAEAEATCVYADRGPWADGENKINYANGGGPDGEEFKFEDDDEQVDLLKESEAGIADLKTAI